MAAEPDVVEPVVAPAPPAVAPREVADAQAAIAVAVHRPPEEDVFALPLLGNEVRVGEQVVEDVGVEHRGALFRQLLAELVALDVLAARLTFREVEGVLLGFFVPLERAALLVLLDRPAIGNEGLRIAVDYVFDDVDGGVAEQDLLELTELVAFAGRVNQLLRPAVACERHLEFGGETNIERKVAHSFSPLRMSPFGQVRIGASGLPRREGLP